MRHTKGKWEVEIAKDGNPKRISTKDTVICDINYASGLYPFDREQTKINARLISKAPEMYEALKTIRDAFWSEGEKPKEQVKDLKSIAIRILNEIES
jgi:hypothetical protein